MIEIYYLAFLVNILSAVRRLHPDAIFAREQASALHNIFFEDMENIISEKLVFFFLRSEKKKQSNRKMRI